MAKPLHHAHVTMVLEKETAESTRLKEDKLRERNWKRWGPYLSERQWGTVREDYSPDGSWSFGALLEQRRREADEFYHVAIPASLTSEQKLVARQSYAGLLWSKQFYHYIIHDWLEGDPEQPRPPATRLQGRNSNPEWRQLFNKDVVSMPDKWEYPWYATWDLAFHMLPMAKVDPEFAKDQLMLFLREWYMAPNGQMPAYEFALSDVNPPVHALAVHMVYKTTGRKGHRDNEFLARCFQKLLINFT
ncbi:predicted protein, partial [Nematostella vectensis]